MDPRRLPTLEMIRVEKARRHLLPFVQLMKPDYITDRYHAEVCQIMENFHRRVQRRESPRVIIVSPPQHGKTEIVSRHYPAWALGQNPDYCLIGSSYNQDWASSLCRDVQKIMLLDDYHTVFPGSLLPPKGSGLAKRVGDYFELLGATGRYKAAGRGASPAGRPAHILIIDDMLKGADEAMSDTIRESAWQAYTQDLRTRVQKGGGIIIMHTRWHLDDPIGRALENAAKGGEQWDLHLYPAMQEFEGLDWRKPGEALAPSRFDEKDLLAIKSVQSAAAWSALYQGRPVPLVGNILQADKWKYYGGPGQPAFPDIGQFDIIVASWDSSFKEATGADFVSGQVWGIRGAEFWLFLNGYIFEQMGYTRFKEAIRQQKALHPYVSWLFIEDTANGPAVINELQAEIGGIHAVTPAGGKIARAWAASADLSAGNCFLPDASIAPWVGPFVARCARFPGDMGKPGTDDDIDAWSQMVNQMRLHTHPLIEIWKERAEAKRREDETKVAPSETKSLPDDTNGVKSEPPHEDRELALAQVQSATGFGGEKFVPEKITRSTLSKPTVVPQTPVCPQCSNKNLSRYGELIVCNACGWKKSTNGHP